jgi:hypothetical protein
MTRLSASNIVLQGGTVKVVTNAYTWAGPTNRIWFAATNFVMYPNAVIDANYGGFSRTNGPGAGGIGVTAVYGGAGHGGRGGVGNSRSPGGIPYDDPAAPVLPGSGGGHATLGGDGGGAVKIDVPSGTVTVNGTITANGRNYLGTHGAGGSGGSVFITCNTFAGGITGLLSAKGGNGSNYGAGGGGGRIAVVYDLVAQASAPKFLVRMDTTPGLTGFRAGERGTAYYPDLQCLSETMSNLFWNVTLMTPGFTNWTVNRLTLSNCYFAVPYSNFVLTVSNHASFYFGGVGLPGNALFDVGGNLSMTGTSRLDIGPGATNALNPLYGAQVSVTGAMTVSAGSWVYPVSDPVNGGSVLFRAGRLTVDAGAGFNADYAGYMFGTGPGSNAYVYSGAGYGGGGGAGSSGATRGPTYGNPLAPEDCGSGGSQQYGGAGGGLIRIDVTNGTITLNGTLTATGESNLGTHGAGGSGGGVYLRCLNMAGGTNGLIAVRGGGGGANNGGGGGGGRIAVVYNVTNQAGTWPGVKLSARRGPDGVTAFAGVSRASQDGTIYLPDTSIIGNTMGNGLFQDGRVILPGFTNWAPAFLVISNCAFTLENPLPRITVAGDVTIIAGTLGLIGDFRFRCGGNLRLTNAASLALYAGPTNGLAVDYSGQVAVTGAVTLAPGCWIYPYSDYNDGGSPLFRAGSMTVATGAGFNANGTGFQPFTGYGKGGTYGGGGYGGRGGQGVSGTPGSTNGNRYMPLYCGSGGYAMNTGGSGGGAIRIETDGVLMLDGTLAANGDGGYGTHGAGASGGAVYIRCRAFRGSASGLLTTRGGDRQGNNSGGGGGGGRIAVWVNVSEDRMAAYIADGSGRVLESQTVPGFGGTWSVTNGSGVYNWPDARGALPGTASFFLSTLKKGTLLLVR